MMMQVMVKMSHLDGGAGGGEEGPSGWSCSFSPSPALPVPNTSDLILPSILSMLQPTAVL